MNSKKKKNNNPKITHAEYAGNKKHECTLIITEGDSAAGFARNGI